MDDPADHTNPKLEGLCDSVRQDAGFIPVGGNGDDNPPADTAQLFFWFFESRRQPETDPLVLWLGGGPGCSGLWHMLAVNGPCRVLPDGHTTVVNPYGWNAEANVIWLDQPGPTGFSVASNASKPKGTSTAAAENIYTFLRGFYKRHPSLRHRALFLAGDNYAGHIVPVVAHYLWRLNEQHGVDNSTRIQLKGIAIGNGFTSPHAQIARYLDMANNSYGIQLAPADALVAAQTEQAACLRLVDECPRAVGSCVQAAEVCQAGLLSTFRSANRNLYDIRQPCSQAGLACYDDQAVTTFLNSDRLRQLLGVAKTTVPQWQRCNANVTIAHVDTGDLMRDHQRYVAALLDARAVRVLIYAGDADTICNWIGIHQWAKELDWRNRAEFNAASERPLNLQDQSNGAANASLSVGAVWAYEDQLTFLRVYNSGHMVPLDQPTVALEMLRHFLHGKQF